jgi:hypothetical protein
MGFGLSNRRMLAAIAYEKNCKEVLCCLPTKKEKEKREKKKRREVNKLDYVLTRRFK